MADTQPAYGRLEQSVFRTFTWSATRLARWPASRRLLVAAAEARLTRDARRQRSVPRVPPAVYEDKLAMGLAFLHLLERALAEDRASAASLRGLFDRLVYDNLIHRGDQGPKQRFAQRHGCNPPDFFTISPGKTCNLQCQGCYANSGPTREKLDWPTLDRLVDEASRLWGTRFFVLSGGEPFAYHDEGKGVLELAERHPDCFFLMYTNGTLISDKVARRLGELGNLSPGISVEGLRERTDARRGAGVFDRVLEAMERLRRHKVVFGLSLTATRENSEEILSPEMIDLFFRDQGALYAWVFHYMPIGRAPSLDLMMTPEQRVRLYDRVWSLVRDKRLLIADFWNCGTATSGCVAGGRPGGYFYVDWNGAVSPCVFVPYSPVNLHDLYARGGTLDELWAEPFFAGFRGWQREYGYRENGQRYDGAGNWLMPCLIRDHHADFRRLVAAHHPTPTDDAAREALQDPAYYEGLVKFDRELAAITDGVWRERYLAPASGAPRPHASGSPGGAS